MVPFLVRISKVADDTTVTDEAEVLRVLQDIWPGMAYHLDIQETWADGHHIINLPYDDESTLEHVVITTWAGYQLEADIDI